MHQIQFQNQPDQDNHQYFFKIVLVGNPFVGKSQILSRFTRNYFQQKTQSTIGVQCASKKIQINGKIVKIQLWDTMGQQRFRAVTKSFYKNAVAAILVYSIVDAQSFQDIQSWLEKINENSSSSSILVSLVGNKIDLEQQRKISYENGEAIAKAHKMKFFEVSAATGINITKSFHLIAQQLVQMINRSRSFLKNIDPKNEGIQQYLSKKVNKGKKLKNIKKQNQKMKNINKCC